MASHEIQTLFDVVDVAFNNDCSLMAVLHQHALSLYAWDTKNLGSSAPSLTGRATFNKETSEAGFSQQIGFSDDKNIIVMQPQEGSGSIVRHFGFDSESGRMEEITKDNSGSLSVHAFASYREESSGRTLVQSTSGELLDLSDASTAVPVAKLSAPLPWVETIKHGEETIAFGLSNVGNLYANNQLLVKNCTSFLVTSAHLIFTTTTHLLKFVHITRVEGKSPKQYVVKSSNHSRPRNPPR
jgi:elongator complex protein 1